MIILINDILQLSDAPAALLTPALSHSLDMPGTLDVNLDQSRFIDAIGIGNTNGTYFDFTFSDSSVYTLNFTKNGLYTLPPRNVASFNVETDATFIGRMAAGRGIDICTSIPKEPGWNSTADPRVTLSGQVIEGRGGYNYRTLSLDSRYQIKQEAIEEIQAGYKYIGMGYPFFLDLTSESYKLPYNRLYAEEKNQRAMSFEGGINSYRYSRRWEFTERF